MKSPHFMLLWLLDALLVGGADWLNWLGIAAAAVLAVAAVAMFFEPCEAIAAADAKRA